MVKIHDATPPADFPDQVIFMDRHISKKHPEKGFYLRFQDDSRKVDIIWLDGAITINEANKMARDKGFEPTHWVQISEDNLSATGPFLLP